MSFSPSASRRPTGNHRNGISPNRRDLSPSGHRDFSPPPSYNYHNNGRPLSPTQPITPAQPHTRTRRNVNPEHPDSSIPLLEPHARNSQPPLAGPEVDDIDSDDRETVNTAQPGVDDGFFSNNDNNGNNNPDAEAIPEKPKDPEPIYPNTDVPEEDIPDSAIPEIGTRAGPHPRYPEFPYAPGFGPDIYNIPEYPPTEFGGTDSLPDVNVYQHKKTLAQGMMDIALFSANANQLRYVLESYNRHPYYYPSIVFISFSLLFQIAVGVGLIWNARYNVKDKKEICLANRINNFTIIGIFLVTVINVFISAFGVANAPSTTSNTT